MNSLPLMISELDIIGRDLPSLGLFTDNQSILLWLCSIRRYVSCLNPVLPLEYTKKILNLAGTGEYQVEVSWILANLTAGESCMDLVRLGVVEVLQDLTRNSDEAVVEHAYWGLSNIAGSGPSQRDLVCLSVQIWPSNSLKIQQKHLWLLSNILKQEPYAEANWYTISIAICMSTIKDKALVNDTLELISNLLLNASYNPVLVSNGLASSVLQLNEYDEEYYFSIIYSLTSGNEVQYLIDNGVLSTFMARVLNTGYTARLYILQSIYNISLGPIGQVYQLISIGLVASIISVLSQSNKETTAVCIDILASFSTRKVFLQDLFDLGVLNAFTDNVSLKPCTRQCISGLYEFLNTNFLTKSIIHTLIIKINTQELDYETQSKLNSLIFLLNSNLNG